MDFKKLNEQLNKFLEGDVVSFMDYKRNKIARRREERNAEFEKEFGDEIEKELNKFILVEIEKVKVLACEGPIKNPHFEPGEEFSYENFQEDLWARDYMNQIMEKYDKCDIELYLSTNTEKQTFRMRCTIGGGKEECDIYQQLEMRLKGDKEVVIKNDPVKYNENYYKQLVKEYDIKAPIKEDPLAASYVKDYSKGGTKKPEDVEIGDILYGSWLTHFYKVIGKTSRSVKLARLGSKIVSGDSWQGKCIPTEEIVKDQYVDGKNLRIGTKWSDTVVCQVAGHGVDYWDGKPKSFDTLY